MGLFEDSPHLTLNPGTNHTHSLHCPGSRWAKTAQDHRVGSAAARSSGEPRLRLRGPPPPV